MKKNAWALILVLFSLAWNSNAWSQSDTLVISVQDSILMDNLHSLLKLTPEQTKLVDRIIATDSNEIYELDKEHQRIARTEAQTEERDQRLATLREKKKNLKEMRELNLRLALNSEQWSIYQEKIKPGAPSVVHMGMNHDRATCTVCLPK